MDTRKRNHYLPQLYLRNFVQNHEKDIFWVYYKGEKVPRLQTPVNTGIEKHLYNVKRSDGSLNDSIEKYLLSPIEGKVGPIIKKLIATKSRLKNEGIFDLALFLSFMETRTPRSIQAATEVGEALSIYLLKDLVNKPDEIQKLLEEARKEDIVGKNLTVEIFQNHLNELEARYKISFDRKYATGVSLMTSIAIFKELINMNWCLCRAPSNMYFITSDSPLVCFVLNNDGSAVFGGGFRLPNAEITFPLSPNKCLYLDKKHTHHYRAISSKVLKEINKRTAWAAERFIISPTKNNYVHALNNWASESRNFPKMDRKKLFKEFSNRRILKNNGT
jgi:hypothetical protein